MLMGPCVLTLCQQLEVADATQHSISTILPLMPEAQGLQGEQDSPWTRSIDRSNSREEKTGAGENALRVYSQAATMPVYYRSPCIFSADIL